MRVAPNGDIFIAETGPNRIRILRAADGRELPEKTRFSQRVSTGLRHRVLSGGNDPQWIYVANNNSVVRFPYKNGDLKRAARRR